MRATDVIMKKRGNVHTPHGSELTREELQFLIDGYVKGEIPDYQVSAWLMAVYFNGMTFAETGNLTDIMLHSGDVIELNGVAGLTGPFVDKHSTGGVGDKISLPLAPIVAACGVTVPMMSGRALGHTGGTLDKLESMAGFNVKLEPDAFRSYLKEVGFAMTGQTEKVVPADRLLYALRDVTGTVESIPLITASILSKKVAEGSDALVFDVKYGSGAFMKKVEDSVALAESLVKTAQAMGKKASALITNMETPLGRCTGNWLEIEETIDVLKGCGPKDVTGLTYALGAEMLILGGKAANREEGMAMCRQAIESGKALELFLKNVSLQGADADQVMKDYESHSRRSSFTRTIMAEEDGYISIDAYTCGLAGVTLGVGRNKTSDAVCPDAGFILHKVQGEYVHKGEPIMQVFGKDEDCFITALPQLESAITYSAEPPEQKPLIYKEIH